MVGLSGFEPLTSRLSAVRSSQLSYRPEVATGAQNTPADENRGIEEAASNKTGPDSLKTE
jgi:hypothetical protein